MSEAHHDIRERLARVREEVSRAASRAGRRPEDITIVTVTKKHGPAMIEAAHAAGVRHVGENYAQELVSKLDQVACAQDLTWHFIGKLQRNKVKFVAGRVALVHAVDSPALAQEIDRRMAQVSSSPGPGLAPGKQGVLVAVNMGGEEQKSGVMPEQAGELVAAMAELGHVECRGLMTMPPLAERAEDSRRYFRALSELRERLRTARMPLPELSMGTTDDFEVAVEEGATLVRIGTAIMGRRPV